MRADISFNRLGWLYRLDYKKLIIIVFLVRFILASAYDIFVTVSGEDIIVPDSRFYSVRGRYVSLLLQGYDSASLTSDLLPGDDVSKDIFFDSFWCERGALPTSTSELNVYFYIVGFLYSILGYFTIWIRIFNICLSILSVYLLFDVAKRCFGVPAANLFLLVSL